MYPFTPQYSVQSLTRSDNLPIKISQIDETGTALPYDVQSPIEVIPSSRLRNLRHLQSQEVGGRKRGRPVT